MLESAKNVAFLEYSMYARLKHFVQFKPLQSALHTCVSVTNYVDQQTFKPDDDYVLLHQRTRLSTVGDRAFPVVAARLWNSLPSHVTAAPSLSILRCRLKSHLFSLSYPAF